MKIGNYEVERGKVLGEGGFGKVHMGHHVKTGERVAIKQCRLRGRDQAAMAMQEIKHFQAISPHKHIVRMRDHKITRDQCWIVLEYCDLGNLGDYMGSQRCSLDRQVALMHQSASAVYHLHTMHRPIIHRDIKPENILCKRENGSIVAKLTDFGISKITEADAKHMTALGTPVFMAPERLAMRRYDFSADTYELGLVYLAMIIYDPRHKLMLPISETARRSGEQIALGEEMLKAKRKGRPAPIPVSDHPNDCSKLRAVKKLVRHMTQYKPEQRLSMREVLRTLEEIDGERIEVRRGEAAARRPLHVSNLHARPAAAARGKRQDRERGADRLTPCMEEPEEEVPDAGYRLLRGLLEDHLLEGEEPRGDRGLAGAKDTFQLMPLMALLRLAEFEVGDRVVMVKDREKVMQLQDGHGGWRAGMEKYLGEEGVVKELCNGNRDVKVKFSDGKIMTLNAEVIEKDDPNKRRKACRLAAANSRFKLMDLVRINVEEHILRKSQKGHGGYNSKMSKSIGEKGVVVRILDEGDVYVEFFSGDKWSVNPDLLEKVDMSGEMIEAGDLVAVIDDKAMVKALQEDCGGWNSDMAQCLGEKGMVKRVGINGRAVVEVGEGHEWCWSIQALRLLAKGEEMVRIILRKTAEEGD